LKSNNLFWIYSIPSDDFVCFLAELFFLSKDGNVPICCKAAASSLFKNYFYYLSCIIV